MTRDMVLNELPGKSIESICGAALLSCSRGATPMHWSHADVHARKMLCQQHRTTRTAPLIDFLGFAHVPRASPLQPRAVSACPPVHVHSASIYYLLYIHSPHYARYCCVFPIQSNSLRSVAARSASSFEKCRSVVEDPSSTRQARCAALCGKRAGARWWTGASARSWRRTARTCTTRSGAPSASPPPRISSAR